MNAMVSDMKKIKKDTKDIIANQKKEIDKLNGDILEFQTLSRTGV